MQWIRQWIARRRVLQQQRAMADASVGLFNFPEASRVRPRFPERVGSNSGWVIDPWYYNASIKRHGVLVQWDGFSDPITMFPIELELANAADADVRHDR